MNLTDHAGEIRRHHEAAHTAARTAVEHALVAGRLLAEAKDALPHGAFEAWVSAHCNFSARTARRYMQLDAHRDSLPAGAGVKVALEHIKTVTVSDLNLADDLPDLEYIPKWLPPLGSAVITGSMMESCWLVWQVEDAEGVYVQAAAFVVDESAQPVMTDSIFTKRGIRPSYTTLQLKSMGLAEPDNAEWRDIPVGMAAKFDAIVRAGTPYAINK